MAHVHGAGSVAAAGQQAAKAGAAKAMEHGMEGMMKNMMTGEGMAAMMKNMPMGEGMAGMMGQGMAKAAPAAVSFHNVAKGAVATGAVAAGSSHARRSLVGRLIRNPWVLFALGVTAGYLVHKHRKDIVAAATRISEKGKDFVLQQRENLEDIVAESRESED
ncbi:MAG: hypothetical protein H6R26_2650 [Proteobacteria bacterium]|nr:hypothetical protein [Pseudomonadota bacterium]